MSTFINMAPFHAIIFSVTYHFFFFPISYSGELESAFGQHQNPTKTLKMF